MSDNIFNKPITGDVQQRSGGMVEQADPELLVAALDAVLAVPEVVAVKWDQFTPYFNDGDPCEFGVGEPRYYFTDPTEEDEEASDYDDTGLNDFNLTYTDSEGERPYCPSRLKHLDPAPFIELSKTLESGQHYVMLAKTFGDPSEVKATREGFEVESVEATY